MSGDSEQLCAVFSQNFQQLEHKYNALQGSFEAEQHAKAELVRELEVKSKQYGALEEVNAKLKKDLEEALQYKDRYYATHIAMEHLKGRLASTRKGLEDRDAEHQHEVEQLRAQIGDLLRRVETTSDAPLLTALRTQKGELEERCALTTGQLLEERERSGQQLVTANGALRDAQSRLVELEQRCRALDSEVTSMRQQARLGAQTVNEANAERESVQLENGRLESTLRSLHSELSDARLKLEEQETTFSVQKIELRREADHQIQLLNLKVQERDNKVEEAFSQRSQDADKLAKVQRSMQAKVQQVREESGLEVERLRREADQKHEAMLEAQSAQRTASANEEELRRALSVAEDRLSSADRARHGLQLQLDDVNQRASWAQAEKERAVNQMQQVQVQLEAATSQADGFNGAILEAERLRLQLQYSFAETEEMKRQLESDHFKAQAMKKAYEQKIHGQGKEIKDLRKEHKDSLVRLEKHKRKLMAAVIEKEHEIAALQAAPASRTVGSMGSGTAPAAFHPRHQEVLESRSLNLDPLALLKAQSEAALQTQQSLHALEGKASSTSPVAAAQ